MAPTQSLETPEARKARHFDTLRRLGTLAMDLAQDAHALAKQQLAPRPRPAGLPANIATVDYARIFAILSRAVRQAIALEIRRETEPRTRPSFRPLGAPPGTLPGTLIDPRRPLLRTAFHAAIAADPDRARLRPQIDQHIDGQLEADPEGRRPIVEIVDDLVNSLGIDLDPARLPDALLGIPPRNRFAEPPSMRAQHGDPDRPGAKPPPTR